MILSPSGGKSHLHLNRKNESQLRFQFLESTRKQSVIGWSLPWYQTDEHNWGYAPTEIHEINSVDDNSSTSFISSSLDMKKKIRKWPSIWIFWNASLRRYACSMIGSVDFSKYVHGIFWSHSPPLPSLGPCPSSLVFLLFQDSLPSASFILCIWTIPFHQAVYSSMHKFASGLHHWRKCLSLPISICV